MTKIGDKRAELPLIQGSMGAGVSLSKLAGAVAKEGGVGIISSAQIGFREEDFGKRPINGHFLGIGLICQQSRRMMVKILHLPEF